MSRLIDAGDNSPNASRGDLTRLSKKQEEKGRATKRKTAASGGNSALDAGLEFDPSPEMEQFDIEQVVMDSDYDRITYTLLHNRTCSNATWSIAILSPLLILSGRQIGRGGNTISQSGLLEVSNSFF